jgi:hypothetical protein
LSPRQSNQLCVSSAQNQEMLTISVSWGPQLRSNASVEATRPVLVVLPTGARWNRWKITVKVTVWPASTDGLDGDLARLQQWPRWEDGLFAYSRQVAARLVRRAVRGRASAAAAVGFRTKASGRRVVRRVPRGRIAPAFCCVRQHSRRVVCATKRRQARGAPRAPLMIVKKILTASVWRPSDRP